MLGKKKCKMLRQIRRTIADENGIPFITEDCRYKGDCKGTCPKCESELRYLEEQLAKRRALGIKVTVSALAVGLITTSAGCRTAGYTETLEGDVPYVETELEGAVAPDETGTGCETSGDESDTMVLVGEVADETESEDLETLEGDVAYTDPLTDATASVTDG